MKIRNKKDVLVIGVSLIGIILILVGIIGCIYSGNGVICFLNSNFIWVGLILMCYGMYAANKHETEILPDERTKTNSQKAGYNAFWIILSSVGLMFLAEVKGLYNLEVIDVLSATIVIGLFSYFSLDFYYNKIGIRYMIRYIKENKFLYYTFVLFGLTCLVGALLIVSLPLIIPLIIPDNLGNIGFVDDSNILKPDQNFAECGDNFTEYRDIESAKQALIGGNIFLFFVVHEDYLETGRITVYSKEGTFSDFTPTTIEEFLKKNLLIYANVSDKIILKLENPEITEKDEDNLIKQANISYEIAQRIRNPMVEEKVIVKKGDGIQ